MSDRRGGGSGIRVGGRHRARKNGTGIRQGGIQFGDGSLHARNRVVVEGR